MRCSRLLSVMVVLSVSSPVLAQPEDRLTPKYFDADGVKLAYFEMGKGEPVVLLHGLHSSARVSWVLPKIFQALSKDFQVLALDARGHGLSERPNKEDAYGTQLVEDVVRLLDHRKIQKAHIVGYSMGGMITAQFLVKHPGRALTGTLCGAGWLRADSPEQKFFDDAGKDEKKNALCMGTLGKLALTESEVQSIRVPVTILVGERDGIKKVYVEPAKQLRSDWRVVEIPNANHINCIARPQFRDELISWLKKS